MPIGKDTYVSLINDKYQNLKELITSINFVKNPEENLTFDLSKVVDKNN